MQKSNQGIYDVIATGYRGSFFSMRALLSSVLALSLLFVAFSISTSSALTTVPTKMNFQGRLADSAGNVKANGTYNMRLKLYTVDTGGSAVWSEDRLVSAGQGVTITNGTFSIQLGSITTLPASLFASGALYFEVELPTPATATSASPTWTEGPMTPRNQMATSAYAYNAETLDGFDSSDFTQVGQSNTFTSGQTINVSSASAFSVQDGTSVSIFKVDTSSSTVSVGTADATGTVLVLDTKNTAGDPTGTNGGSYYNSNSGKFRCYEAGAWKDCDTGGTIASGTTAQRPGTPAEGSQFFDTTIKQMLTYANGKWQADRSSSTVIVAANDSKSKDSADFVVSSANEAAGNADATITAAIASLPVSGGTVYLMEGTYTVDTGIVLPSKTTLAGAGSNSTTIRLKSAHNGTINVIDSDSSTKSNIAIKDLRIDGNKAAQTAGTQNGIYISRVGSGTGAAATSGMSVRDTDIVNFRSNGIDLYDSQNGRFENVRTLGNTSSGFYTHWNVFYNVFSKIESSGNGIYGFHIDAGRYNKIIDSKFNNNASSGVKVESTNTSENSFSGNTVQSNTGYGFDIRYGLAGTYTNNYISSNGSGGIRLEFGINASYTGAVISNNTIASNTGHGIVADRDVANATISGNRVYSNTNYGIYLSGYLGSENPDNNSITGNYVYSNAGGGIGLNEADDNLVQSNNVAENGGATSNNGIVITGGNSTNNSISNNVITDASCTTTCYALYVASASGTVFSGNTLGTGTIFDTGTGTLYANQINPSGQFINRASGGFAIQGTAGTNLISTAGTASVNIGTSDTTGTVLVLDVKTDAGDPTGIIGAMYYNSNLGKFRCYQGSAWTDCVGAGINNSVSQQTGANFNIDGTGTASILQAGTFDTASAGVLNIGTTNATSVSIAKDTSLAAGKSLTIIGGNTASRPLTPVEGTLYYEQTTDQMLVYANGKWQGDRSSSTKIVAASNSSQAAKDAADYVATGTADQTQINAALTAAAGGTVYLMEGIYTASATIVVPTDTVLSGSGRNTLIRLADIDVSDNLIEDSSSGKITIRDLRIDGQKSLNTAGTQNGIYLDGLGINTAGALVENVEVYNFRNAGIQVYDSDNSRFNNIWVDSNDIGIYVYAFGDRSEFTKITAEQNVSHGISFSNGANNTLRDSVSRLNGGYGVSIGSNNNVLTNNTFISNTGGGIYNDGDNTSINNNDIRSNTGYGINSGNFTYDTQLTGNNIASNGSGGAYLRLGSSGWTVSGNTIVSNTGMGIEADRANENNVFTGNTIRANTTYGLFVAGYIYQIVPGQTITGNSVRDNGTAGIYLSSVSDSTISGNVAGNNGGATTNNGIVIANGYSGNNNISGNTITDTSCTTNCYAITINGNDNQVSSNTIGDGILVDFAGDNIYGRGEILDNGTNTIYTNQRDTNGNLINRGGGGLSVNTSAVTSSLTLQGGLMNTQLPTPTQPKVANVGTAGVVTYGYKVTALDGTGETLPSTERTTTTGNATLNGTNYNVITWAQVQGAVQYKVYRTTSAGTPGTTGLIATIIGANNVFFNDTGIAAGVAAPVANTTGGASFAGVLQGSSATLSSGLTVNGTTSLNNTALLRTTSATAFQIQNSSNVQLFIADTSTMKVTISALDITGNLTVNGHIISGGSTPTIAAGAAACTTPTMAIAGTDTAGLITVTTGTSCSSGGGLFATVTFNTAFGSAPRVILTPANDIASRSDAYVNSTTTSTTSFGLTLSSNDFPFDSTVYRWYYQVIQ